jgi:uncharacterized protein (DUF1810 family)
MERATGAADDPYNLERFVQVQEKDYEQALSEIQNGRKRQAHETRLLDSCSTCST